MYCENCEDKKGFDGKFEGFEGLNFEKGFDLGFEEQEFADKKDFMGYYGEGAKDECQPPHCPPPPPPSHGCTPPPPPHGCKPPQFHAPQCPLPKVPCGKDSVTNNSYTMNGGNSVVCNKNYYNNYYTRYNHIFVKNTNIVTDYVRDINIVHYSSATVYNGCRYLGSTWVVDNGSSCGQGSSWGQGAGSCKGGCY